MTRTIYAATDSAASLPQVRFRMLAEVEITSSTLYLCTGNNFVSTGVQTYSPIGDLGGVDPVRESDDLFPRSVVMWLSAVDSSKLYEPLTESLFNKPARLYRTFLNENMAPVSTPELMYQGRINRVDIKLGDPERGNYFEIEVESRLYRRYSPIYFSQEGYSQLTAGVYSGDTLFKYIEQIFGFKARWGDEAVLFSGATWGTTRAGGGGGGGGGGLNPGYGGWYGSGGPRRV